MRLPCTRTVHLRQRVRRTITRGMPTEWHDDLSEADKLLNIGIDVALGEGGGLKGVRVDNVAPDDGPSIRHLQGEVESYREPSKELRDKVHSLEEPSCRGGRMSRYEEIEKLLAEVEDRKSTRLNSSHANISYDVFCL